MTELNPSLSPERWNPLYQKSLDDYRDQFRARVKDLYQSGFFVGQVPFRDHQEEAEALVPKIPALIAITQLPYDINLEPRKQRAQQMLRRYQKITTVPLHREREEGRDA